MLQRLVEKKLLQMLHSLQNVAMLQNFQSAAETIINVANMRFPKTSEDLITGIFWGLGVLIEPAAKEGGRRFSKEKCEVSQSRILMGKIPWFGMDICLFLAY